MDHPPFNLQACPYLAIECSISRLGPNTSSFTVHSLPGESPSCPQLLFVFKPMTHDCISPSLVFLWAPDVCIQLLTGYLHLEVLLTCLILISWSQRLTSPVRAGVILHCASSLSEWQTIYLVMQAKLLASFLEPLFLCYLYARVGSYRLRTADC